ncbi:membrane protein [Streptomyces spiroverticillatus]|uniref:Membrane protein n=1 Tax=Streptomyces finlayi TaxID=67296 RepID=A0A918X0K8_9ACTN|nr:DUF1295 domain-containing protein [Streptomyces finlayi]GHA48384.1 membrane protein [Streptomyces spiroverticillatus]GHD01060.1 membrane protein [Streptomyces finlayi]
MNGFPWGDWAAGLGWAAGAALAVMLVTFAVAVRVGMHRVVDAAWGIGFAAVAVVSYVVSGPSVGDDGRRLLVLALTCVWGLRLAAHIAWRGRGHGEDPRYENLLAKAPEGRRNLYAFRMVYLLQGALVWLVSLPVQAGMYVPGSVGWVGWAGCALWAVGLFFEAVGDRQMSRFKADPANKGKIMDRGLWSLTRHPNYFGDFCVWWGIFLVACGSWGVAGLTVVGPLVMSYLLIWGSGKRLLERSMAKRPGFAEYAARTNGFFPWVPKR